MSKPKKYGASGGRLPDYKLLALDKESSQSAEVGAGWLKDDGSIGIKINYLTIIHGSNQNLVLTLFPTNEKDDARREQVVAAVGVARQDPDVPF